MLANSGLLADRIAIVTGGAGNGIGHGISFELAEAGAHVVIADIDSEAGERVAQQILRRGRSAVSIEVDVSNSASVQSLFERVARRFERVDILVNSAGVGLVKPLHLVNDQEFQQLLDVDLRGVWLCCKQALQIMTKERRGSIINISSIHHQASLSGYEIYAAAKAGVNALTRGIAIEYGNEGIRANSICPGLVDGTQTRKLIAGFASDVEAWISDFIHRNQAIPVRIQPEDVGRLAVFLASDLSRCITGAQISLDCGTLCLASSKDPVNHPSTSPKLGRVR